MENIILPAIVLGIRPLAVVIQLMRNSLETLSQDYIRTARAKGLSEFQVIRKHALKNFKSSCNGYFGMVCLDASWSCFFVEYILDGTA
jgi:peptide/nickel transport system permease protein